MSGYKISSSYLLLQTSQVLGAAVTAQPVTQNFGITEGDSLQTSITVVCTDVTAGAGITAKLQDSYDGGTTWEDACSVAVTADGHFEIVHNVAEGDVDPLWNVARVVVTTGAGSAVTVDAVYVSRRL